SAAPWSWSARSSARSACTCSKRARSRSPSRPSKRPSSPRRRCGMANEAELRQEIADERRKLTDAVADLRQEIDQTAERGKRIGIVVGALAAAALTVRTTLKIRRHFRD